MPPDASNPELAHADVAGWALGALDPADAEAFFVAIASKSPSGQRQTLSALRALFGAFLDAHLIAENPFLRKQLAFHQEREIRPRRLTNGARLWLVF